MMAHYIDFITFAMATLIVLLGASKVKKHPINVLVVISTCIYMVAQSTWFSAWLVQNEWGRDFANYIWFAFNTSVMVVFGWTLLKSDKV